MSAQFTSTIYALGAVCTWGVSDFVGGYTARRFNAFFLAALGHLSGTALVATLALANQQTFPEFSHFRWALAAGASGGVSLALFYRALSQGNMGLAAPVSAILGAAIPTVFGMFTEGLPGAMPIFGFVLALLGIWLISRSEEGGRPKGIVLAMIAGCGFALFFIFMRQAGTGSALWLAACSRGSSLVATGIITVAGRKFSPAYPLGFILGLFAGCVDVTGTVFFIRASQTGRLDSAVVITSLYPAITVLLARVLLKEHFTRWRMIGIVAALAAVALISRG
jgi:drug/metabolite transporter (DMT)-like permease